MLDRRQVGVAARKERIVDAARDALQRDGAEPSMRQLASEAGVSVATLYNLMGGKEAILLAVLDAEIDAIDAALRRQTEAEPIARAHQLVESSLRHFIARAKLFRPLLGAIERQSPSGQRSALMNRCAALLLQSLHEGVAAGSLRDDVPPDVVARQIVWGYVQAIRYWAAGQLSHNRFRAQVQSVLALGLLALAEPESRGSVVAIVEELAPTLRAISRSQS